MDWGYGAIADTHADENVSADFAKPVIRVVQIFANPHAGTFSRAMLDQQIHRLKVQNIQVIVSMEAPFRLAETGVSEIIIIGGDGTIRDALECVVAKGADLPITIIPAGTVNLLHRELSGSAPTEKPHKEHYLADMNGRMMMICASGGPDSHIVQNVSATLKKWIGRGAYGIAALKQLLFWQHDDFILSFDNQKIACSAFYIAKGKYYAGPWSFAPNADARQPLFYGVAVPDAGRWAYLKFATALLLGRIELQKGLVRFSCDSMTISSQASAPVQVDGDCIGHCPVELSINPKTIRLRSGTAG